MAEGLGEMTHQDIWDDSLLVNSWNEALAEYKKYHSIHVTGGDLDSLVLENEQHAKPGPHHVGHGQHAESATTPTTGAPDEAVDGHATTTHMSTEGAATTKDRLDSDDHDGLATNGAARGETGQSQGIEHTTASIGPSPQALLGSVQDETLKRMLMSWYYAGFYTGLYEGQQKQRDQQ